MRIAVLYDDVDARAGATADERGVLEAVEAVDVALGDLGHAPVRVGVGAHVDAWVGALRDAAPDLVFNLCEGAAGSSAGEARVAAVIELMRLPLTGSGAETLALARRKDRTNALLERAGVPVPSWTASAEGATAPAWNRFPAIVKPAAEDASVGITQACVARDAAELERALTAGWKHAPLLVQEFLRGRELNVGIVGERVLAVAEIDFAATPEGSWPMVGYAAKWAPGSVEDLATVPLCPAPLAPEMLAEARRLALAAWATVEGRGYGRVDLRGDADGRLFVLEVNPNPDLAPSAGLTRMAAADGLGYAELVERIVREAA